MSDSSSEPPIKQQLFFDNFIKLELNQEKQFEVDLDFSTTSWWDVFKDPHKCTVSFKWKTNCFFLKIYTFVLSKT